MNKKILFLSLVACVIIVSGCDTQPSDISLEASNVVVYEVCNDLALPCGDVHSKQVDRYSPDKTTQHNSRTADIHWDRKTPDIIDEYLLQNNRTIDVYNIADGIQWNLIWYQKWHLKCVVLGTWEIDEEFIPSGDGVISLSCFQE